MNMNKLGEVYKISWSDGCYVGSAKHGATSRWSQHLKSLRFKRHTNRILQSAYNKVGATAFTFSILETNVPLENLNARETEWSIQLKSCNQKPYNRIPDKRKEQIVRLIKEGKKVREIAEICQCSIGLVSKYR